MYNKTNLPTLKPNWQNISEIKDLNVLIRQYPNQKVVPQFIKLKQNYPKYRSVRGDGNCFYRAFAFMFLRQSDLSNFDSVFKRIMNVCTNSPIEFYQISFEKTLQEIYENEIQPISKLNKKDRQTELMYKFNNSQIFDTVLILYFRSLNYYYLKNNIQKFREFIHDDFENILRGVCRYDQESQGLQLSSLVDCLDLRLIIMSADQKEVKTYSYNEKNEKKQFIMFLRPGHYDILYDKDSEFTNIQRNTYFTPSSSYQKNKKKIVQVDFNKQDQKLSTKKTSSTQLNQKPLQKNSWYTFSNRPSKNILTQTNKNQQHKYVSSLTVKNQYSNQKCSKNNNNGQFKNINSVVQTPGVSKLMIEALALVGMLYSTYYLLSSI